MPGAPGTRGLVLAGTHSGCGKTSVTLGLLRALARRGLPVQPFKAGPDFIDPGLHAAACGRMSHNLDTWMLPEQALRGLFARHALALEAGGVCVVEGVMGLFDGRGAAGHDGGEEGSTAHLAKLLGLPVVLAVDASSQARSVAALVQGFAHFDPELKLAGVILNRVGSDSHADLLRRAVASTGVPVLGCLRRDAGVVLPSRHLGLVTAQDAQAQGARELEATLDALADLVERGLDIPALLASLPEISLPFFLSAPEPEPVPVARIGLARDRAFCFVYEENLRLLAAAGAEIAPFSPLADAQLPPGLDGLLLPGGYPELAAAELSANAPMRAAIRGFCRSGRPVWAECGGFMYLLEELVDGEGRLWPMCGAIPGRAEMGRARAALGYRTARTLVPGPLGPAGTELRGHEFHYSRAEGLQGQGAWSLEASSGAVATDGWASGSVLGGYFHAHLASNPQAAANFVSACARRRG